MLTPTALTTSVAAIANPRDLAARDEALQMRRRRARLFPLGSRVYAAYRLDHQPHPYKHLYDPLQRTPLGEVCRYAGVGFSEDVYDAETDRTLTVTYHLVSSAGGKTYHVLTEDLSGVEIEAPTASVPATIPPACRELQCAARMPHEPLRQVLMRLVAHVVLIVRQAGRSLYTADGALHVGPHATLTPTPRGVLVDHVAYPVCASLSSLRRLVNLVRARLAAAEEARFFADLHAAVCTLPGLAASLIPRDGTITIQSNRYPRLKVSVTPGAVRLASHLSPFQQADGQRAGWIEQYQFSTDAVRLHAQIAAHLQVV